LTSQALSAILFVVLLNIFFSSNLSTFWLYTSEYKVVTFRENKTSDKMEKETKNWWVIHVTTDVTFDYGESKNESRWTSEFITGEEVLDIICIYAGLTYATVFEKQVAPMDNEQMKNYFLDTIKNEKNKNLFLDNTEGHISLQFGISYYGSLCVKVHCLDFDGTRNFTKELTVVKKVANQLDNQ